MSTLTRVSPTSLTTFDESESFGCERKWWFKYVQRLPDPQGPDAAFGDRVHKAIETAQLEGFVELLRPAREAIAEVHQPGWRLELKFSDPSVLAAEGVELTGRIDALNTERGIIRDWKTKKDLRYVKSGKMLEQDLQMQLYAAALGGGRDVEVQHGNIASRPPFEFSLVRSVSTAETRQKAVSRALALVRGMRIYTSISDVNETKPNRGTRCSYCAYKNVCPTGEKTMSLLDMLMNPAESAVAAVAPVPTNVAPAEVHKFERKLPIVEVPDPVVTAPEPHPLPEQAPPPPPLPAPTVPEGPRRRGRPLGSKNKAQAQTFSENSAATAPAAASSGPSSQAGADFKVRSITVTRGATVQVIQFEPMNVSLSATADVAEGASLQEALKALDQEIFKEVVARVEQLRQAQRDVKGLKP